MNGYNVLMKGVNGNIFGQLIFANSEDEAKKQILDTGREREILSISKVDRFCK